MEICVYQAVLTVKTAILSNYYRLDIAEIYVHPRFSR